VTDGDWHVVTVLPHVTAVLLRGALLAEGVRTELDRDALGAVYGLDTGGHATRVLVRPADLDRARRVLAELDRS
jgi:hypothetical protein